MLHPVRTEQELKEWILRKMGAGLIKVEITDDMLDDSIEDARRWFSAKKGMRKQGSFYCLAGENEYPLPDDVDVVLDVTFPSHRFDLSTVNSPWFGYDEAIPYNTFYTPQSGGLYSSYSQTLQYVEMAKRIIGAELEWYQDNRKLVIMPAQKPNGMLIYDYKPFTVLIEQLSDRDHDLLKRYALAMAKGYVGRVRSKYQGFPGAQGSNSLDGQALLQESQAEVEKLEQEIADSAFPMGFQTG